MGTKDTAMKVTAIRELFKESPKIKTVDDLNNMFRQLAEAQAEFTWPIAFKAGKIEGMRLYSKWLKERLLDGKGGELEAKLKEWDIKV